MRLPPNDEAVSPGRPAARPRRDADGVSGGDLEAPDAAASAAGPEHGVLR